jgi:parvulin-like peptidyl-prolyl isomerase
VLNSIINFEVAVQEARRLGLDKDPQVMERMDAVLYQSLIERQLADKIKGVVNVSDKEARDYCSRNPPIRISHVYVALKPSALKSEEAAAEKKIKEAQAALAKGMKFEEVVANYSEGYAVPAGGDTGYVNISKLDPAIYRAARKLSVGEVTKTPVRSQLGLHLVKLTGVQNCKGIDIPEWQRLVFDERRLKLLDNYLSSLRSKAKVSVNQEVIKE